MKIINTKDKNFEEEFEAILARAKSDIKGVSSIVMNIIEAIRRKPLNQEIESYITLAGVAIMVVLMIAVTWNDIMRAFF